MNRNYFSPTFRHRWVSSGLRFLCERRRSHPTHSLIRTIFSFFLLVLSTAPPCFADPGTERPSPAIAVIDGKKITVEDVESPLSSRLYRLRDEIYQLQQAQLSNLLAEELINREAKARGISVKDLIQAEVLSKVEPVAPGEVDQYFQQNKASFANSNASEEQIKASIQASLQQQKTYQKTLQFAETLKPKHSIQIFLREPELPRVNVSVGNAPTVGSANAPVTIIEFSDYQCPSCKKEHATVRQLRDKYGDKLLWAYKDFPLGMNEVSIKAAEAAHCARDQSKFFEYQDLLFNIQDEPSTSKLKELATSLNLDRSVFDKCLDGGAHRQVVLDAVKEARAIGIDRTPSFVINGRLFPGGPTFARFDKLIGDELKTKASAPKGKK